MMRSTTLLLAVRAENQASGALRVVASDLNRLNRMGLLGNTRASVAAKQQATRLRSTAIESRLLKQQVLATTGYNAAVSKTGVTKRALTKAENELSTGIGRNTQRLKQNVVTAQAAHRVARQQLYTTQVARRSLPGAEALATRQLAGFNKQLSLMGRSRTYVRTLLQELSPAYFVRVGTAIQHTGRALSMFGMVATAAFGATAYMAAKFATSVTLAATQTRKAGEGIAATAKNSIYLQGQILKQMKLYPASSDAMSEATYDIYSSLDISLTKGTKVLDLFNRAAVGGQTDLNSVTQAGITVMNDFKINSIQGLTKAFDVLFASVRFGRMTFQQLTQMMPQMAPAFSAAGYGLLEMAQSAAFMTRVMPNTARASTSLARLVEMFGRKDFVAGAAKMGAKITDIHNRLLPLPAIVEKLAKAFPDIMKGIKSGKGDVELQNIFKTITAAGSKTGTGGTMGTIQGRRAMIFMITQLGLMKSVYKQVKADQNEFMTSYNAMKGEPGVRLGIFVNQLKALGIELGAQILPILGNLAKHAQRLLKWWEGLSTSTKDSVAKWAALGSIFMFVGGIVLWLGGTVLKLITLFASMTPMFIGLTVAFVAGGAIIMALTGHWDSLKTAAKGFFDLLTGHGIWGWVAYFTMASFAIIKLARLFVMLRGAILGVTATRAAIVGFEAAVTGASAATGVGGAVGGTGLIAALGGAGMAAGIFGGAIAIGAAGLLLYKANADAARKAAENLKRIWAANNKIALGGLKPAKLAGTLPGTIAAIDQAKVYRDQAKDNMAQAQKNYNLQKTTKNMNLLRLAQDEYAASQDTLYRANAKSNQAFQATGLAFDKAARAQANLTAQQRQRAALVKELNRLEAGGRQAGGAAGGMRTKNIMDTKQNIANLDALIAGLQLKGDKVVRTLGNSIYQTVTKLSNMGAIFGKNRAKLTKDQIALVSGVIATTKRMLSQRQIEIILGVKKGKLAADVAAALRMVKRQVAEAKYSVKISGKAVTPGYQGDQAHPTGVAVDVNKTVGNAQKAAAAARAKAAAWLQANPVPLKAKSPPVAELVTIGESIVSGVKAGMTSVKVHAQMEAAVRVVVSGVVGSFKKQSESHSPSRRFAREVGLPITLGIAKGLLAPAGKAAIEQSASSVVNLFQGALVQKIESGNTKLNKRTRLQVKKWLALADEEMKRYNKSAKKGGGKETDLLSAQANRAKANAKKIKVTITTLIKDTQQQAKKLAKFNKDMDILSKNKNLPTSFLEALEAMGVEGLKYLDLLVKATPKQLKKLIAAWQAAQKAIEKAQTYTVADLQEQKDSVIENLKSMYDDFHGQMVDAYGALFSGLDELLETKTEAIQDKIDKIKEAFGDLFSGTWLSSDLIQAKQQWGAALTFVDIFNDLKAQTLAYLKYTSDLVKLAAAVPADLYDEIAALGPSAESMISALLSATPAELAEYIAMWRSTHDAAVAAAVITPQDILDQMTKQAADFSTWQASLAALAKILPAELIQQLTALGPSAEVYLQALQAMTPAQRAQFVALWEQAGKMIDTATQTMLTNQLAVWQDHGVDIIQALIDGMAAAEPTLTAYLEDLFLRILNGESFSSTTTAGGGSGPGGTSGGSTPPGDSGGGRGAGNAPTYVTQNVYATKTESLETTLAKATFKLVNRT